MTDVPIRLLPLGNLAFHESKHLGWLHSEASSEVKQRIQGRALLPALQLPDVVPVVAGLVSEGILRTPLFLPELPKHRTEGGLGTGGAPAPGC